MGFGALDCFFFFFGYRLQNPRKPVREKTSKVMFSHAADHQRRKRKESENVLDEFIELWIDGLMDLWLSDGMQSAGFVHS